MVFTCVICQRHFESLRGHNRHYATCKRKESVFIRRFNQTVNDTNIDAEENEMETARILEAETLPVENVIEPQLNFPTVPAEFTNCENVPFIPAIEVNPSAVNPEDIVWGNMPYSELSVKITDLYNEIVHFRRNIFKLPTGKAGKAFVEELTFWLNQWNANTKLNEIAMKAFMILPTLLLQKPSMRSKAKDHSECLQRRIQQWKDGKFEALIQESRFIQNRLSKTWKPRSSEDIARIFSKLIMEGKISSALKFLDKESSSGPMKCSDAVLEELKSKHPDGAAVQENSLLFGPVIDIPHFCFDSIDEKDIFNAASRTKGSSGPSGMDAECYRRILCSKSFGNSSKNLREEIAQFTRNIAKQTYHPNLLDAYVSSRLIALDKNPGIRPIGVGEVLRRIVGKVISHHCRQEIKEAAGPLQTCAGHGAGAEAAIHAMAAIFQQDETDAVLLIDATNAFNCLNRKVALHNICITCPLLSLYLCNTYRVPSKLFIAGGFSILSKEGTTQGDPLAMPWYALSTVPLIDTLQFFESSVKQAWLADDASAAGKLHALLKWYNELTVIGEKLGYYVNHLKCWLIVKSPELANAAHEMFGKTVNITTEGKRHLGACIGSKNFKKEYCDELVNNWKKELDNLCDIAETQPQAAYAAYTKGYRSKFTHFMRTIDQFEEFLLPIDDLLHHKLLPAVFGGDCAIIEKHRDLLALNTSDGGLGINCVTKEAVKQYKASKAVTTNHVNSIMQQCKTMIDIGDDDKTTADHKREVVSQIEQEKRDHVKNLHDLLPDELRNYVSQACDKGASSWLNTIPLKDQNLDLNKVEFTDAIRLRYNAPLPNLPSFCPCGEKFNQEHAMNCKKGGFITERHDNIRDFLTICLDRVCKDVQVEPHLIKVTDEKFKLKSANTTDEARLDMKARGFWRKGETAFFDVRITHVNSVSSKNLSTAQQFRRHEEAKKREYLERVLEVENGSFTPLVFGTNGGMGSECAKFLQQLAAKMSEKNNERYEDTICWLKTRLSMEITRSSLLCLRGSRTPFRSYRIDDIGLDNALCGIA